MSKTPILRVHLRRQACALVPGTYTKIVYLRYFAYIPYHIRYTLGDPAYALPPAPYTQIVIKAYNAGSPTPHSGDSCELQHCDSGVIRVVGLDDDLGVGCRGRARGPGRPRLSVFSVGCRQNGYGDSRGRGGVEAKPVVSSRSVARSPKVF